MSSRGIAPPHRQRFSLSVRVSLLLMFAAIVPLVITIVSSEVLSRPALLTQARTSMDTDARERVQLINSYLSERLLDAGTLSQVPTVQSYLATPPTRVTADATTHAIYALAAGIYRDKRYTTWALFDPAGHLRLYFPLNAKPQPHGQYLVPPADLRLVTTGAQVFFSGVYFDAQTQKASVDIYAPIIFVAKTTAPQLLGFMRASLNIDYIVDIVQSERGANGTGSYAFLLDQNGVRIADTDSTQLFKAVAPLAPDAQVSASSEALYGNSNYVPVIADDAMANALHDKQPSSTFQTTPSGQNEQFEVTRHTATVVPWNYFVLSPLSTITAVADQQLRITAIVAAIALLLAALIGLYIGRRLTRPILYSVDYLRRNSEALNTLASKQKGAAAEQRWVVDSSQVGLQSVQYYTGATSVAAHRLRDIANEVVLRWPEIDARSVQQAMGEIINAAQYIENAAHYQDISNQKLATALKVTTQVTEQLATGATSAADAATQLEQVVNQLRNVVGR